MSAQVERLMNARMIRITAVTVVQIISRRGLPSIYSALRPGLVRDGFYERLRLMPIELIQPLNKLKLLAGEGSIEGLEADDKCRPGVKEIRVRDEAGIFRMRYLATRPEGVYVLHCFQKKTQRTSRSDVELATKRFKSITR